MCEMCKETDDAMNSVTDHTPVFWVRDDGKMIVLITEDVYNMLHDLYERHLAQSESNVVIN